MAQGKTKHPEAAIKALDTDIAGHGVIFCPHPTAIGESIFIGAFPLIMP